MKAYSKLKETYSGQEKLLEYLDEHKYPDSGAPPVCQGFHLETYSPRPYRDFKEVNRAITFKQFLHGNRHDLLDLKDKWEVVDQVNHAKDLARPQ